MMKTLILIIFTFCFISCGEQSGYEVKHNTAKKFDTRVKQEAFHPHIFRYPGSALLTYSQFLKSIENLGSGYQFSSVTADEDDGFNTINRGCITDCSESESTNTTTINNTSCGNQGSIKERIANCKLVHGSNAEWIAETSGTYSESNWKLVMVDSNISGTKPYNIWQDQRTKILWTSQVFPSDIVNQDPNDPVSGDWNWCQVTGEYQHASCSGEVQRTSACESMLGEFPISRGSLDESDGVHWTIPTMNELLQANINGGTQVLDGSKFIYSRTTNSLNRYETYIFGISPSSNLQVDGFETIGYSGGKTTLKTKVSAVASEVIIHLGGGFYISSPDNVAVVCIGYLKE